MESTITSKGQATIPKAIREHLGLKPGIGSSSSSIPMAAWRSCRSCAPRRCAASSSLGGGL